MKKYILISALLILTLAGCNTAKDIDSTYANHNFEVQCVDTDGDYEILRSWGKGNDKDDSIEQAKKNALRAVMFKGITGGNGNCRVRPIILAVNAEENNRQYFNEFFAKKGPWKNFVKIDEKRGSRKVSRNNEIENWEVTVVVDVDKLISHLAQDKIIQ